MATSKYQWFKDRSKVTPTPEENSSEVVTKPSQTQSVREILFKNTNGMHYDNFKTPFYEDQATFSTQPLNVIQQMDLVEKLEFLKQTKLKASALEKKIKDYKAEQDAIAEQARIQNEAKALLEKQQLEATSQEGN